MEESYDTNASNELISSNTTDLRPAREYTNYTPKLETPPSGGAVRSIGEKLSFNPATGSSDISVPINLTPARGAPELVLAYSSGSGNSEFGLGWSLGVPQITRKTGTKLPEYNDYDESDVFLLAGAEDLVPVSPEPNLTPFTDSAGNTYSIKRYQPRTEGIFSRIEKLTNQNDPSDIWWRVTSRDNVTQYFGYYPNPKHDNKSARTSNPEKPQDIFSWSLCETVDDKRNRTLYQYKQEDNLKTPPTLFESNRLINSKPSQIYLKSISYGNKTPNSDNGWSFQIILDYGEHDTSNPTPTETNEWLHRDDSFSSYRSGFEIRTRRLCQRILCFHHLPDNSEFGLGKEPSLVKSTNFQYKNSPVATQLNAIEHTAYIKNANKYDHDSSPAVTFEYSSAELDEQLHEITDIESTPQGLSGAYQFTDLNAEGLSGILTQQAGSLYYRRNEGNGEFGRITNLATQPNWVNLARGDALVNLEADGQPYLVNYGNLAGYIARDNEQWESFEPFKKSPNINRSDNDVRYIDLNGDGKPEIVILREEVIRWYPSEEKKGYGEEQRVPLIDANEDSGPTRVFTNTLESIFTADMSGDGLTDLVRIRGREICYWPNLGYGRFGAKVTMADAPHFDAPDLYDPKRLRLADINGNGQTDILYLGRNDTRFWLNQSGNSFSAATEITAFPGVDNLSSVSLIDLLGNGTSCLVWSSPLPSDANQPWRYIDLMSGTKPYLLTEINNNLGSITKLSYKPSTWYYLKDRREGKPWISKLHFPVQVVDKQEVIDIVSGNRFVSRYSYHHGYYDRAEREFRGFGRVDQWDTEGITETGEELFQRPPVMTRTWFHTGTWLDEEHISTQYRKEYFLHGKIEDKQAFELADSEIENSNPTPAYTPQELREAKRSLRGQTLRQEVYACDPVSDPDEYPQPVSDTAPYTVTESRYQIKCLQRLSENKHGVFLSTPLETISYQYEQKHQDPRISHELTLKTDEYGQALKTAAVVYPRRTIQGETHIPEQNQLYITVSEVELINVNNDQNDWYRIGVPQSEMSWEVTGITAPTPDSDTKVSALQADDIRDKFNNADLLDYAEIPTGSTLQKRLLSASLQLYRSNADAKKIYPVYGSTPPQGSEDFKPLDYGELESLALPGVAFSLVITDELLSQVNNQLQANQQLTAQQLSNEKYTDLAHQKANLTELNSWLMNNIPIATGNGWWTGDGSAAFDPDLFYAVTKARDPWQGISEISYDSLGLLPVSATDAVGNTVTSKNNYRLLSPEEIIDPNGNRQQVAFDTLGRVTKTAVMGKVGETLGDELADPNAGLVDHPTTEIEYHFYDGTTPSYAHTRSRETHYQDDTSEQSIRWLEARVYSDGLGQEILSKAKVAPGKAFYVDANENLQTEHNANPRWVGSGRTLLDNKCNPVKQWEPYFSISADYEADDALRQWSVTPVLHYDPLGRAVRTDMPDGTYTKVVFTPWEQTEYDANDTVEDSEWYLQRTDHNHPHFINDTAEQRAAQLAIVHKDTPTSQQLDTLGRPVLTIERNNTGNQLAEYETRLTLDITGNQLKVTDANSNTALEEVFDLAGRPLRSISNDAGMTYSLPALDGQPALNWIPRGEKKQGQPAKYAVARMEYDALRRPRNLWVQEAETTQEVLREATRYGDVDYTGSGQAEEHNLRGQVWRVYDGVGLAETPAYDFKGNPLQTIRHLFNDPLAEGDWTHLVTGGTAPTSLGESFTSAISYDALNRPVVMAAPDGSQTQHGYDASGALYSVALKLAGQGSFKPQVTAIQYNEKGQRLQIDYGNNVITQYRYDPQNFRLIALDSARASEFPISASTPPENILQGLRYHYDAHGNIVEINDISQPIAQLSDNATSSRQFEYDGLNRLIQATGREHIAQNPGGDQYYTPQYSANDPNAMRNYTQNWQYDPVGNIAEWKHHYVNGGWTRSYSYDSFNEGNNHLAQTTNSANSAFKNTYIHDAAGNITEIQGAQLTNSVWNFENQPTRMTLHQNTTAHYRYDASGERVRKLVESPNDNLRKERIYLGGYEVYRKWKRVGGQWQLELRRDTLYVMDDERRIALVEIERDVAGADIPGTQVQRYQLDDHLQTVGIELDGHGNVISFEEFHAYGTTAFHWTNGGISQKRYRYTGMERDEESGFAYHSARFYLGYLGRWLSCDPLGTIDSLSLFNCFKNNPISFSDSKGTFSENEKKEPLNTLTHEEFNNLSEEEQKNLQSDPGFILIPNSPTFTVRAYKNTFKLGDNWIAIPKADDFSIDASIRIGWRVGQDGRNLKAYGEVGAFGKLTTANFGNEMKASAGVYARAKFEVRTGFLSYSKEIGVEDELWSKESSKIHFPNDQTHTLKTNDKDKLTLYKGKKFESSVVEFDLDVIETEKELNPGVYEKKYQLKSGIKGTGKIPAPIFGIPASHSKIIFTGEFKAGYKRSIILSNKPSYMATPYEKVVFDWRE